MTCEGDDRFTVSKDYVGREYFLKYRCNTCRCLLYVKLTRNYLFNNFGYKDSLNHEFGIIPCADYVCYIYICFKKIS